MYTGSARSQPFLANYYNLQMMGGVVCPWHGRERERDWQRHSERRWWRARETDRDGAQSARWQKATEQRHKLHTVMRGFVMRSSVCDHAEHTHTYTHRKSTEIVGIPHPLCRNWPSAFTCTRKRSRQHINPTTFPHSLPTISNFIVSPFSWQSAWRPTWTSPSSSLLPPRCFSCRRRRSTDSGD